MQRTLVSGTKLNEPSSGTGTGILINTWRRSRVFGVRLMGKSGRLQHSFFTVADDDVQQRARGTKTSVFSSLSFLLSCYLTEAPGILTNYTAKAPASPALVTSYAMQMMLLLAIGVYHPREHFTYVCSPMKQADMREIDTFERHLSDVLLQHSKTASAF